MQNYILMTDDNCDLPGGWYGENGVAVHYMPFIIDGETYTIENMSHREFYDKLRAGSMPTTTQATANDWTLEFEPRLAAGEDVLYLAFSSGLSATADSAELAARALREKYPERKCVVVDTLCASLGQGLLVHHANRLKKQGMPLDDLAQWVRDNRLKVSHMVAADDLMHLHRGGRVSKTSAVAGTMLGIKPIIYMDNEGHLIPIGKVRGRKQALQRLVDLSKERMGSAPNDIFMICHSDCEAEANEVAALVKKQLGIKEVLVHFIGPVIGTHTGPGTIAVFVMADHR
jgi:DegV family protein with EDD domain